MSDLCTTLPRRPFALQHMSVEPKDNKTAAIHKTDLKDVKIADPNTFFKYIGINTIDKEYSQHTIEIDDERIDILIKNMGASDLGALTSLIRQIHNPFNEWFSCFS
jgi:hypothetical protein